MEKRSSQTAFRRLGPALGHTVDLFSLIQNARSFEDFGKRGRARRRGAYRRRGRAAGHRHLWPKPILQRPTRTPRAPPRLSCADSIAPPRATWIGIPTGCGAGDDEADIHDETTVAAALFGTYCAVNAVSLNVERGGEPSMPCMSRRERCETTDPCFRHWLRSDFVGAVHRRAQGL